MWYFFVKVGHSDIVLLEVTWSGKVHALMKFQCSGAYEKGDMGLQTKTKYVVLFRERRSQ